MLLASNENVRQIENSYLTASPEEREKGKEKEVIRDERSEYLDRIISVAEKPVGIRPNSLQTKRVEYKGREEDEVGKITCKEKESFKQQEK